MQLSGAADIVATYGRDPFLVLVGCILSLRTKDTVSVPAAKRLFNYAREPHDLMRLAVDFIQQCIYPVGFYRQKARQLVKLSSDIVELFGGQVPSGETDLLSLPGVGRKTMNLVRGEGFGIPALCVDTHVHRIANRLGLVRTISPEGTERALKECVPPQYWVELNHLLVMWGQNVCVPVSPKCSICAIAPLCPRIGVIRSR